MSPEARRLPVAFSLTLALAVGLGPLVGCSKSNDEEYKPKPQPSGRAANLPSVPTLPQKPKKDGDAYTVYGAIHDLRSSVLGPKIRDKEITLVGFITKTNLSEAPACAVHKTGVADGKECEANPPPVPAFWVADEPDAPESASIKVMGFASNYAKLFDAIQKYKAPTVKELYKDDVWAVEIPNPIPNKGAKVKVTGTYGTSFQRSSQGPETNPLTGILTYKSLVYVQPPPTPGVLPGAK